jgi:hypothetical protein
MKAARISKTSEPQAQTRSASGGKSSQRVAASPQQRAQSALISQLVKKHHDPAKKKYLAKGVGAKQNWISARQLALIQGGMARADAKRQAAQEWAAAHP